jgi:hypothetical protein
MTEPTEPTPPPQVDPVQQLGQRGADRLEQLRVELASSRLRNGPQATPAVTSKDMTPEDPDVTSEDMTPGDPEARFNAAGALLDAYKARELAARKDRFNRELLNDRVTMAQELLKHLCYSVGRYGGDGPMADAVVRQALNAFFGLPVGEQQEIVPKLRTYRQGTEMQLSVRAIVLAILTGRKPE